MADEVVQIAERVTLSAVVKDPRSPTGYRFGARTPTGADVLAIRHPWCHLGDPGVAIRHVAGDVVYGGLIMDHFGHFILEAMSRLWYLRKNPGATVAWHRIGLPVPHSVWAGRMDEVARLLDLQAFRNVVIDRPTSVDRLVVPKPGYDPGVYLKPEQALALQVWPPSQRKPGSRLWLSRSALPSQFARILHEDELQERLARRGWNITYPEQNPVTEQIAALSRSETVAGFAGSAFHALLLLRSKPSRVIMIERPAITMADYAVTLPDAVSITASMTQVSERQSWSDYSIDDIDELEHQIVQLANGQ